ncbi:PREDICTED: uncharacterized protein LOC105313074 [Amphimedon queenslandica]|uniref:Lysine-specific metallo-endopeptidase domain-containing protein n=2 Tax=Amphimedon queenslandica TaxID=400682 RepID=A0AAN0IMX5_AMPQE|nr:PREDICTED: uncharacterized protein LOC105313074 [Amphimedon queenslandica]|eukprot:XP_011404512.2 PREDICTED: uncharacterized protein LOC105313074 [Amphimedon queenslandica]
MKIIVLFLILGAYAMAVQSGPLSLDMACDRAFSAVLCTFEFTNNGREDLYLLTYNTPLEGPYSPFITLSLNGKSLQYEGIFASRTPPTREGFALIKARQSVSASIQITEVFSIHRDGHYTVRYAQPLQYLSANEMRQQYYFDDVIEVSQSILPSQSVDLYLDKTKSLDKPTKQDEQTAGKEVITIKACRTTVSVGSDASIVEAHKKLCSHVHKVKDAVDKKNKTLYQEWFEARPTHGPDHGRKNKVKDVFQKVDTGIHTKSVKYVINGVYCQPNWGAYTYKGSTTTYICPGLSNFPTLCSDDTKYNKEGVLLHEWSHAFGHTSDHAYGPRESRKLAKNYPDKAVDNADNYMYYYCLSIH